MFIVQPLMAKDASFDPCAARVPVLLVATCRCAQVAQIALVNAPSYVPWCYNCKGHKGQSSMSWAMGLAPCLHEGGSWKGNCKELPRRGGT